MNKQVLIPASEALILSSTPVDIEDGFEDVAAYINHAIAKRLTSIKIAIFINLEAIVDALVVLGYDVEVNTVRTLAGSWIPVEEFVEITVRW